MSPGAKRLSRYIGLPIETRTSSLPCRGGGFNGHGALYRQGGARRGVVEIAIDAKSPLPVPFSRLKGRVRVTAP